jgi:hypothetical protein
MVALPAYLPLPEAARKYGLDETRIKSLIESGKIKAAMIGETIVVSESDAQGAGKPLRKEDLPEYKAVEHLAGIPIWVSEAAREHNIPHQTILRWLKIGIIKRVGENGNKILIDAADIAYCAKIYHDRDTRQGRRLFDKYGLPYKKKTGQLS